MRIDGDTVKFRNGREEYANCGIIGMGEDAHGELITTGGYDDGLPSFSEEPLTKAERVELAEFMVIQWKIFAEKEI